jgi:hypothetical protein
MTRKTPPKLKDLATRSRKWPKLGKAEADKFIRDIEESRRPVSPGRDDFHLPSDVDFTGGVRGKFYKPKKKGDVMNILSKITRKVVDWEVEFTKEAHDALIKHAKESMPHKVLADFMISWAVGDIVLKHIAELAVKDPTLRKALAKGKGSKSAAKKQIKVKKG